MGMNSKGFVESLIPNARMKVGLLRNKMNKDIHRWADEQIRYECLSPVKSRIGRFVLHDLSMLAHRILSKVNQQTERHFRATGNQRGCETAVERL